MCKIVNYIYIYYIYIYVYLNLRSAGPPLYAHVDDIWGTASDMC